MMQDAAPLTHLHHIVTVVSDAHESTEFYTSTLGLSPIDDTPYDLAFAGAGGGGYIGAHVRPHAPRGRWGLGTTHHVALLVESADDQDRWKRWLSDRDHSVTGPYDRRYFRSIYFRDPDGLILEIATRGPGFGAFDEPTGSVDDPLTPPAELMAGGRDEEAIKRTTWPEPVGDIPAPLGALHHVTCISDDAHATDAFYTEVLGLRRAKITRNFDNPSSPHLYYTGDGAEPGSTITFFGYTRKTMHPGRLGTGVVDHIAYASGDAAAWHRRLREHAVRAGVTEHGTVELTDPSGIRLEIAPG